MSNKYAEISKVKIRTLNKNGKTILDDVYFTSPFKVAPPFYKSNDFIKVPPAPDDRESAARSMQQEPF